MRIEKVPGVFVRHSRGPENRDILLFQEMREWREPFHQFALLSRWELVRFTLPATSPPFMNVPDLTSPNSFVH